MPCAVDFCGALFLQIDSCCPQRQFHVQHLQMGVSCALFHVQHLQMGVSCAWVFCSELTHGAQGLKRKIHVQHHLGAAEGPWWWVCRAVFARCCQNTMVTACEKDNTSETSDMFQSVLPRDKCHSHTTSKPALTSKNFIPHIQNLHPTTATCLTHFLLSLSQSGLGGNFAFKNC